MKSDGPGETGRSTPVLFPAVPGMSGSPRRRAGQSLVEFCISLPLLLVPLFMLIDFAFIYHHTLRLNEAAREGARAGARRQDQAAVRAIVKDRVPELGLVDAEIAAVTLDEAGDDQGEG